MTGVYEQIKDDLGYLQLDRAAEVFAVLADQARSDEISHIEFLARLVGEQADATRNRRLNARLRYARFPFRKTIDEFDFEFQPTVDRRLEPPWLRWRLSCAPGFARSACLIAGQVLGVTALVLDRAEHAE